MSKSILIKHLSKKEKDEFIKEILECKSRGRNLQEIIASWEATAEINSNPKLKSKILYRIKKLDRFLMQTKNG